MLLAWQVQCPSLARGKPWLSRAGACRAGGAAEPRGGRGGLGAVHVQFQHAGRQEWACVCPTSLKVYLVACGTCSAAPMKQHATGVRSCCLLCAKHSVSSLRRGHVCRASHWTSRCGAARPASSARACGAQPWLCSHETYHVQSSLIWQDEPQSNAAQLVCTTEGAVVGCWRCFKYVMQKNLAGRCIAALFMIKHHPHKSALKGCRS